MEYASFTRYLTETMHALVAQTQDPRASARGFVQAATADEDAPVQFGIEQGRMAAWVKPSYRAYLASRCGASGAARFEKALDRIATLVGEARQ